MLSRKQNRRSNAVETARKADAAHKANAARKGDADAVRKGDAPHKAEAVYEADAAHKADVARKADVALKADVVHEAAVAHKADAADGVGSRPDSQTASQPEETEQATSASLLTVTGEQATIEGKFNISESLQIECEVGGELEIGGTMAVGANGVVRADVQTVDALIIGVYEGNMVATGNVEIAPTGRVTANLRTDSLVIERGGFFNGTVDSLESEAQAQAADRPKQTWKPVVAAVDGSRDARAHGNGVGETPETPADLPRSPAHDNEEDVAAEDAPFLAEAQQAAGGR